ncbi:TAXI family TRAP transporter solute-binding subunit [Rhizohabitans arisaemae]|uniref:TAXI family TRAP transporter solute-binding subunit n=1 Tax=Rhizohabitans arisaemae TaxID=2720610 RepID=UPI0024B0438D|nr:TAXI family TRAP transporter solute-binding subunit [Rhizohabitans arisaemae]
MRRRTAIAGLITLPFTIGSCGPFQPPRRLVIATGGVGGVYDKLGRSLAHWLRYHWGTSVEVRSTAASLENLRLIASGEAHIGFSSLDAAALAPAGMLPFPAPLPIASLMRLYDEYLQIVVGGATPVWMLSDFTGGTVSVGSANSGTELLATRLLEAAGLPEAAVKRVHLGVAESAEALRTGRINGFFFTSGLPAPAITELSQKMPIRILSTDDYLKALVDRHNNVYFKRSIPARMYGLYSETPTIGVPNILVVGGGLDTETAYRLTKMIFQLKPELMAAHGAARHVNERSAISTVPVPLHPGAVRYYREAKPMTTVEGPE